MAFAGTRNCSSRYAHTGLLSWGGEGTDSQIFFARRRPSGFENTSRNVHECIFAGSVLPRDPGFVFLSARAEPNRDLRTPDNLINTVSRYAGIRIFRNGHVCFGTNKNRAERVTKFESFSVKMIIKGTEPERRSRVYVRWYPANDFSVEWKRRTKNVRLYIYIVFIPTERDVTRTIGESLRRKEFD